MKKLSAFLLSISMAMALVFPSVSWVYAKSETADQSVQKETVTYHNTEIIASSDQLLYGYLTAQSAKKTKFKLKGDANKALYDILLKDVKDIAAGNKSSTQITVTASEMGIADKSWTEDELGISDTQKPWDKIAPLIGFDKRNLLNALLSNSPYDLYWFNKRKGYSIGIGYLTSGNQIKIDSLTFQFPVYSDYQGDDQYTVDSSKIARVNTAKENANNIVAKYASDSDYTRLKDYKQAICDLVSYNTEAAADSDPTYGDPWQIINVFDNDPDTKVVCEGYAKAFKYLCDLSTFTSDNIDCILVSGTMASNGNGGAHMWNVVTMDDNKNYLVDVTNCDEGSIGEGDYLFLVGDTLKTGSPTKGYTIEFTKPGYYPSSINYTYDEDTLSSYKDDDDQDSNLTLNTSNYEASTNVHTHVYGEPTFTWSSDYSTATATFTCTKGDDSQTVDATVTSKTTKEATEDAEGAIEFTAKVSFNGEDYTETKSKTIPKLAHKHNYGDPTFTWVSDYSSATATFTCTKNDDSQTVDATVTSKTTKEATEDAEGEIIYTATATFNGKDYTETKTKTIAKLKHTHAYGDPTFTWSSDYSSVTATFECTKGDDSQTVDATVTSETTKEATEDAEGAIEFTAKVSFNGEDYTDTKTKTIEKLAHTHSYDDPTFNWSDDYSKVTATFTCAKNDDSQTVDATVTSETTKEATEDAEGKIEYTAKVSFNGKEYTDSKEKAIARLEKKNQTTGADASNSSNTSGQSNSSGISTNTGSTVTNNPAGTSDGSNTSGNTTNNATGTGSAAKTVINGTGKKAKSKKKSVKLSQVTIKSVKNEKGKKVKIVFKKVKNAKKYQISYRMNGKKKWMTKTVTKTTYVLNKLKKKKIYSIRMRAVNGKSYGKWSKVKTVLVRK